MRRFVLTLASIACASQPATHTIEPAPSSSAVVAHSPDASVDASHLHNDMVTLHAVAEAWRANHGNECPTVQHLKDERELPSTASTNDDWGTPYKIVCDDEETRVISYGPDRREGTPDDIVVPERVHVQ